MNRRSRLLVVAAGIGLASAAPWLWGSRPATPSPSFDRDAAAVAAAGPEAVLVVGARPSSSDSSSSRPVAIGLAISISIALLVGARLARRVRREPHRTPRWIAGRVRAPPVFRIV